MALRIKCNSFGSLKPRCVHAGDASGPLVFEIPKNRGVLECFLHERFPKVEIAKVMSVSESTIYRRIRCYALSKMECSVITDEELDRQQFDEITRHFFNCGEVLLKQLLAGRGINLKFHFQI